MGPFNLSDLGAFLLIEKKNTHHVLHCKKIKSLSVNRLLIMNMQRHLNDFLTRCRLISKDF